MDMEKLAAEAAVAAVKELAVSAAKAGAAGAGQLWNWISGKAPAEEASTVAAIEAAPDKASAKAKAEGLILTILETRPDLQAELETLLAQSAGTTRTTQTTHATGGSKVAQVAGNNNTTKIG